MGQDRRPAGGPGRQACDDGRVTTLRLATPDDAAACAAIYAPAVLDTAITFEIDPPAQREMARRIGLALERHTWLVAERDGEVVGYAYGGTHRTRAAYDTTAEVSVYLHADARGTGLGRTLYECLLADLAGLGYRLAVAGITLPNEPSVALHRRLGFEPVGTFRRVGWKFDQPHDVSWWQRDLG